jgi:hypothetical protein
VPFSQRKRHLAVSTTDPAEKICTVLSHPSDKNKGVARVGHPDSVAIHKGRINNLTATLNFL